MTAQQEETKHIREHLCLLSQFFYQLSQ